MKAQIHSKGVLVAACALAVALVAAAWAWTAQPWRASMYQAAVAPKAQLSDYSWDELSAIAGEIASCDDMASATRLAARYKLCDENGAIDPAQTKSVELAGSEAASGTLRVQLVGYWHDERSDGGKAGLSFALADPAGEHSMNHAFEREDGAEADSTGGWAASDMRTWLNGTLLYALPTELRGAIVSVQKRTTSRTGIQDELDEPGLLAGAAADWIDETSDKLWLFSASELCGQVPEDGNLGIDSTMSAVYDSEGEQYRLFADAGAQALKPNAALVRPRPSGSAETPASTWWLRTKTLEFGHGFWLVGVDGAPLNGIGEDARAAQDASYAPDALWGPDHARGVVFGFCL